MKKLHLVLVLIYFGLSAKTIAQRSNEFFTSLQLGYAISEHANYLIKGANVSFDKAYGNYEFGLTMNTYLKGNIANEYNLPNQTLNFYMMDFGFKAHRLILRSKSNKSSVFLGLINGFSNAYVFKDGANGNNYILPPKFDHILLNNSFNYFVSPSVNLEYLLIENKLAVYSNMQYKFLFGNTSFSNNTDFNKLSVSIGAKLLL